MKITQTFSSRQVSDGGATFGKSINLSNNPASLSYNPQLVALGENVYIVWEDDYGNSGNSDIFYMKSSDGGKTFTSKKNLSDDPSGSGNPQISVSGKNIYVVWTGTSPDGPDILLAQSSDDGNTFTAPANVSNDPELSFNPLLSVNGTHVLVQWKGQDENGVTNTKGVSLPNSAQTLSSKVADSTAQLLNVTGTDFPVQNSTTQDSQVQENQTDSIGTPPQQNDNQTDTLRPPSSVPINSTNSANYTVPAQVISSESYSTPNWSGPYNSNFSFTNGNVDNYGQQIDKNGGERSLDRQFESGSFILDNFANVTTPYSIELKTSKATTTQDIEKSEDGAMVTRESGEGDKSSSPANTAI